VFVTLLNISLETGPYLAKSSLASSFLNLSLGVGSSRGGVFRILPTLRAC